MVCCPELGALTRLWAMRAGGSDGVQGSSTCLLCTVNFCGQPQDSGLLSLQEPGAGDRVSAHPVQGQRSERPGVVQGAGGEPGG